MATKKQTVTQEVQAGNPPQAQGGNDLLAAIAEAIEQRQRTRDWKEEAGRTDVLRHDKSHIALPRHMPVKNAAKITAIMAEQEEQFVDFRYTILGFPLDAALSLNDVIRETYGYVETKNIPMFFGNIKPKTITVDTGDSKRRIPWGRFSLGFFSEQEYLDVGFTLRDGLPAFEVYGEIRRVNEPMLVQLMELTEVRLQEHSIYRGKALILNDLSWRADRRRFSPDQSPEFFKSGVSLDDVIMPEASRKLLNANILMRIRQTERCEELGLGIGKGNLFEGGYGTGKTMTAAAIATECEESGWTFFYLKEPKEGDIEYALRLADLYAKGSKGCVLFVEDIDLMHNTQRTTETNRIINALDSVAKGSRVMTIFTTNDASSITPAMRRAGRIDFFMRFERPTGAEALEFIYRYAKDELSREEDATRLLELLDGARMTPAFLEQVVAQARLVALSENRVGVLHIEDVAASLEVSRHHIEFADTDDGTPQEMTIEDLIAVTVGEVVNDLVPDIVYDKISSYL